MDGSGGPSSTANGGGVKHTSGSAAASSPSTLNGGDSDSAAAAGGSNGGQGAAGGDGGRGNGEKNVQKNPKGGMQDQLVELNKQEEQIVSHTHTPAAAGTQLLLPPTIQQAELLTTHTQVTQVSSEREQLEERLQLLRQQEQQLTDKQQSVRIHSNWLPISRDYHMTLSTVVRAISQYLEPEAKYRFM